MFKTLRNISLTKWILIAMAVGTVVGWALPVEQVKGAVTFASPDGNELRITAENGREISLRRESPTAASAAVWQGRDVDRDIHVKVVVQHRAGTSKTIAAGDTVMVEYLKFNAISLKPLSTIFLRMIKSLIVPLIFSTLVIGIAGHGDDMRRVGRLAFKSLIYFEVVTTLALLIGLVAVNITKPGVGVVLAASPDEGQKLAQRTQTLDDFLKHIVPESVFDAAVRNEVLQVVFWSILFGAALAQVRGKPKAVMLDWLDALAQVMFKFTGLVMLYAPIGIGAAIAVTVGHSGLGVLINLGQLILTLYVALVVFMLVVLWPVAKLARVPIRKFGRAIKEPALIAFSTTSSEAALPKAMLAMESIGVPKRIVAFVMPTGYSFNLDGTTLYLAVASVFAAQAAGVEMTWSQQLVMMLTLMVTSKGVAAVPRASLVILSGTLASFGLPLEAVAVILGVDELMDMARTTVNLVGNCLATCVIARWEGEFNDHAAPPETDAVPTQGSAPLA